MKKLLLILCIILATAACSTIEDPLVASFRGEPVYKSEVEKKMHFYGEEQSQALERVFVDRALIAEAKARDLYPTEDEIKEQMEEFKQFYRDGNPDMLRMVNDALSEGKSIDEYWKTVEESLPEHMVFSRMEDIIFENYFIVDEFGNKTPEDISAAEAFVAYGRELLVKYADDIVIYDDSYRR
jgi:hypothetical protein